MRSTSTHSTAPPCSTTFVRRAATIALSRGCTITSAHGDQDQHRHHVVEHRARQREEEHRTGEPADERAGAEDRHPPLLTLELPAVAVRAADRAEHQPDGVAHVGDDGRVPDGEQGGEGDERAGAHDGVDRAREEPDGQHQERLEDRHRARHRRLAAVPDEKPPLDRALDLFVYAPVGVALYVRDMLPSMMGIFVSRGKREVKSHLPGYEAPAPPTPPVPMPDVADIRRKMGDSIGLARGVAGGGIGLARDMTGTALQGLMAFRNLAAQAAAEDQAHHRAGSPTRVHRRRPRSPRRDPHRSPTAPPRLRLRPRTRSPRRRSPTFRYPTTTSCRRRRSSNGSKASTPTSLEAIRAYEASHRGRNTILGKIAQLT